MDLSLITTAADLAALEADWDRLVDQAPEASVFQTFPWQSIWWQTFGAGRSLRIVAVHDQGVLVGLLPLYVERFPVLPGLAVRKLRLLGYGGDTAPDDLGPIVAHAEPARVIERLVDGLDACRADWDIAELEDLAPASPLIARLQARGWGEAAIEPGASIAYVELPASWDGYLAMLSANRRWKLRRGRTKLSEHCAYRFALVRTQAELDARYPDLVRLHHDRWAHRSDDFGFATAGYVGFHREVMAAMLARGWLRLMVLEAADGVIAANYCYRWRAGFYFFQGGFTRPYEPFRIGEVLMGHAIEQAIGEGMAVFDMLRGEHDYKKSLTNRTRERSHLRLYRPTPRTLAYRALRSGYRGVRRLLGAPADPHGHGEHAAPPAAAKAAPAR